MLGTCVKYYISIKPVGMGRIVGKDRCIKVSPENTDVKMMRRKGRNISTPCLMEGKYKPEDTSKITVGICKDEDGKDTFFTAFYGKLAPKEVNDSTLTDEERKESEEFWSNHAIVVTNDMLDPAEVFLSSIIDSVKTSLENGEDTVMIGNENLKIEKIECSDLVKVGNWVINMDTREVMSGHEKMIGDNVIKKDTPVI